MALFALSSSLAILIQYRCVTDPYTATHTALVR